MINVDGIAYVNEVTISSKDCFRITASIDTNGVFDEITIICDEKGLEKELIDSVGKFLIFNGYIKRGTIYLDTILEVKDEFVLVEWTKDYNLIPDGIIKQLSEDSGIPIIDETLGVKPFLDYINEISNIPVIYGLQGATGKYRFFMVVTTNIWMNYNNFNISDGEKDGQISDHFPLEIQLDVEFNYPSAFYYLSKHKRKEISNIDSEDGLLGSDRNIEMHLTFNRTLIPERDEFNNQLYISCVVECDDLEEDSVDISSLFTEEQAKVCLQMIMDGKNPNPLIRFIVYEDEFKMHPDRIYVDWIAKELRLSNTKKNRSYRIAVYINNRLFNDYLLRHHDYTNKIKGGN